MAKVRSTTQVKGKLKPFISEHTKAEALKQIEASDNLVSIDIETLCKPTLSSEWIAKNTVNETHTKLIVMNRETSLKFADQIHELVNKTRQLLR